MVMKMMMCENKEHIRWKEKKIKTEWQRVTQEHKKGMESDTNKKGKI